MATTTNVQKPKTTRELLNEAQSVAAQNYREGKINTPFGYIFARDAAFIYSELDKLGVTDPSKLQAKVVGTGDNEKVQYINGTTGKVIQEKSTSQGGSLDLGGNRDVNGYDLFMTPNASGGLTLASTPPPKSSWVKFRDDVLKPAAVVAGVYFGAPYLLEALGLSGAGAGAVGADLAASAVAGVEGVASQAGLTAYNSAIASGLSMADAAVFADKAISSTAALLEAGFTEAEALKTSLDNLGVKSTFNVGNTGLLQDATNVVSGLPTSALVTGGLLAANAASNALAPRQTTDASGNVTYNMPQPLLFQSRQYTPATGNLYRYGFGPEQAMFKGVGDTSQIGRQSVTAGGATPADQLTQQKLTPAVIATPPPAVSPTAPVGLAQSGLTSTGLLGVNTGGQVTPIVQPVDQGTIGLLNQGVQVDINPNRGVTDAEARQIFKAIFGAEPTEGQFANFSNNRDMFKNPNELGVYLIQERERLGLTPVKQEQQVTTTGPATSGAGTSVTPIQTSVGGSPTIVNAPLNMGGLLDTFSAAPPVATYISPESASQIFQNVFGFAPNQQQITNFNTGNMFTTPAEFQGYLLGEAQRLNIPTLIS